MTSLLGLLAEPLPRLARAIKLLKQAGARWLERVCGAMLITLAGSLALYRRHAA